MEYWSHNTTSLSIRPYGHMGRGHYTGEETQWPQVDQCLTQRRQLLYYLAPSHSVGTNITSATHIDIEYLWCYREVDLVSTSAVTRGSEAQFHVLSVYLSGVTCWNPLLISKKTKVSEQQMQSMHVRMEVGEWAAYSPPCTCTCHSTSCCGSPCSY